MLLIFNSGSLVFSAPPCVWRTSISNMTCPNLKSHHSLSSSHSDCCIVFSVWMASVAWKSDVLHFTSAYLLPIYFIISLFFCLLVAHDSYLFCFLSWARSLVLPQVAAEFPLSYLCVTVYTGKACLGHFLGRCVHLLGWSGE